MGEPVGSSPPAALSAFRSPVSAFNFGRSDVLLPSSPVHTC